MSGDDHSGRDRRVPRQGAENAASPSRRIDRSERWGCSWDRVAVPLTSPQDHVEASLTADQAGRSYMGVRRGACQTALSSGWVFLWATASLWWTTNQGPGKG